MALVICSTSKSRLTYRKQEIRGEQEKRNERKGHIECCMCMSACVCEGNNNNKKKKKKRKKNKKKKKKKKKKQTRT